MKRLIILLLGCIISIGMYAQGSLRQGKVSASADGEPLAGVSVMVKGTSTGTITDIDGNFTINAKSTDVLLFSYVGYEPKEIPVGNQTSFSVTLKDDQKVLDEIVVVGYGVQKKSVVTAAIGSVGGEELEKITPTRIDNVLKGQTSGVIVTQSSGQPGAGSKVRIRGNGTINDSDPLYIVDGFITGDDGIDYLNPQDIERVEVLKDAASAAVYGARGANGVILITTKKGGFNKKTSLKYDFSYGWQNPWKKELY